MGPRCCVFKFPAVSIIITASQRLAFQTGFYTLASVRKTFGGIEGAGWRRRKVKKQKAREKKRGWRPIYGWNILAQIGPWGRRLEQLSGMRSRFYSSQSPKCQAVWLAQDGHSVTSLD